MFRNAWNFICKVTLIIGVFLLFIVAIELLRIFVFFYRMHPVAGWVYAGILLAVSGFLLGSFVKQWRAQPRVLTAPELPGRLEELDHRTLVRHCRYLIRYLARLAANQALTHEQHELARLHIDDLEDTLRAHPLRDDLIRGIQHAEQEGIAPLVEALSEQARAEVRHSVRDVMLGVSLSPYHSMDVFIVIYRNASMVLRIARIFASRPAAREQLLILRDTFRVVATVNIFNLGKTLIESLFAQVPVIGRTIYDIGQGLGAGLLTSASGHAAIERCAAFRSWEKDEAVISLADHAVRFFADVRDLFTKDVLPSLRGRIKATTEPEKYEAPGFWESITRGIGVAVDASAKTLDTLVLRPAAAGGRGVAAAGTRVSRGMARAGSSVARATVKGSHRTYRGLGRVLHTFGQRMKYTMNLGRVRRK